MTDDEITALICLVAGLLLLFWRGRRKFLRLNSCGVEQFPNYFSKVASSIFDHILFGFGTAFIGASSLILMHIGRYYSVFFVVVLLAYQFRPNSR